MNKLFFILALTFLTSLAMADAGKNSITADPHKPPMADSLKAHSKKEQPRQQQQQHEEYNEDGFEDIQSDSYGDNGNGTTINQKIQDKRQ